MEKKIFVGNLSFQVNDFELEDLFKQYGEVASAKVITDRMTGRSRGFGFVEMNSEDSAKQAVEALNGADLKGRPINVSFARKQEQGGNGGGARSGGGFNRKRRFENSGDYNN